MKKFRMILSALAIVFAIAGVFVTNASPKTSLSTIVTDSEDPCNIAGTCTPGGTVSCEEDAQQQLFLDDDVPCSPYTVTADEIFE